jgi:hypothetical protein
VLVGYARVSTDDQDLTLQRTALKQAGCKRIYEEKVSGATRDRPALTRMLDQLREGDVVVVARLDRLARSTRDLLEIAEPGSCPSAHDRLHCRPEQQGRQRILQPSKATQISVIPDE